MIYLDNAATSFWKPESVIRAVGEAMRRSGNAGRGTYGASLDASRIDVYKRQAVMCHDDRIAFRLIQLLKDKGIRVPEDMAVTGFDDSEYATMDISLTTIVHPQEELGRRAARAVLELLKEPGQEVSCTFPAVLRTGRSTDAGDGGPD